MWLRRCVPPLYSAGLFILWWHKGAICGLLGEWRCGVSLGHGVGQQEEAGVEESGGGTAFHHGWFIPPRTAGWSRG